MKNFVYDVPVKVYFGPDQLSHLGEEVARLGQRVLLVYGKNAIKASGLYDRILTELKAANRSVEELSGVDPNPRIATVREGAALCKEKNIDVVLAVGGGSTIDAAKFIAAAAAVSFDPWDFFSKGAPVEKALPLVTVLTLAATGSEMNSGGVISNPETIDKLGWGGRPLLPKVSFLDPTNTFGVSAFQTACGSADIISHVLEIYFHPEEDLDFLDFVMEAILKTVVEHAPKALKNPQDYEARANLMWASSWAINGFIRGGKTHAWSCHPMEHELSAYYDITHGLGLAILTPAWLEEILSEKTAPRIARLGEAVFGLCSNASTMERAQQSIEALRRFFTQELKLTGTLSELNIDDTHFDAMAEKSAKKTEKAYVPLNKEAVAAIYRRALK
ncbi:NADH-dependent butanol dehydrogenase A [Clostridiaceae bacterium JG1575]|nr:NADH-dependent butanol dehydrogenase A [Clostridiaceae bacterium JG1575]